MSPATRSAPEKEAREEERDARARTEALPGAAASLSLGCQVPGIGTSVASPPPEPLAPFRCGGHSLLGARASAAPAALPAGVGAISKGGSRPLAAPPRPRHPDSSSFPVAFFLMQVPGPASRSRGEKAFGD